MHTRGPCIYQPPKFVVTELLSSNWYCASEKHHKWAIFISQQQSTHETCRHKDTTSPTLAGSIFRSHIAFTDFATAVLSESDFILAMNDCAGLLFFSVCPSQPMIVRREAANLVRHPLWKRNRGILNIVFKKRLLSGFAFGWTAIHLVDTYI